MSEEKKATVIVVTRDNGAVQRYDAPNFGALHDGTILIGEKIEGDDLRVDAMIAAGRWVSVHKDGATAGDGTAAALGIAKKALDAITRVSDGNVAIKLALDALGEIYAETDRPVNAGMPERDLQAEEAHREFTGWAEAQGYDDAERYDFEEMEFAFTSGMEAERDLVAAHAASPDADSARDALDAQSLHDSPGSDL